VCCVDSSDSARTRIGRRAFTRYRCCMVSRSSLLADPPPLVNADVIIGLAEMSENGSEGER
jgi:hypothetical protein